MQTLIRRVHISAMNRMRNRRDGMELVQVAILVAIAILVGLIFRTQVKSFVDDVFSKLSAGKFS